MSGISYSFIASVFFGGSDVVVEHPVGTALLFCNKIGLGPGAPFDQLLKHQLLKHQLLKHQLSALKHQLSKTSTVQNINCLKHQLSKTSTI